MVRATDRDAQPSIRRQAIINRLDIGSDLAVARVGRIAVVAQEKHERTRDARPNDATQWSAVDIDTCLAPGIVMAELCGRRPTEGVAEYSHARHVEPSRKRAGRIGAVQLLQPIEYERDVASAHGTPPCVLRTVTKYRRAVEVLFEKKLLSVALCTETLASGINLPARSVVVLQQTGTGS